MFAEAGRLGGLEVQLVFYRGLNECRAGHWASDTRELANSMTKITCMAGYTQIGKILAHVRKEHAQKPVNAAVFVGDAMEETPTRFTMPLLGWAYRSSSSKRAPILT
jgi:hypothetical protein